jgi:hypothetical protein
VTAPLIERRDSEPVPATWCVAVCEQGCYETWTVDVADFDPRPTLNVVEAWLSPMLLAHEQREHEREESS